MKSKLKKFFKNKKILVTGHTGFKGAWLCLFLKELNAKIYGVSLNIKKNSLFEKTDLKKKIDGHYLFDILDKKKLIKTVNKIKPEIIFHFAAQSLVLDGYKYPVKTFQTNFNGTLNILDITLKSKFVKKILVTTTDKVYDVSVEKKFKENDKLWGSDPYSASKVASEQLIDSFRLLNSYRKRKKIIIVARSGNVIGPGDIAKNRIIPDILNSIKRNSKLIIRHPKSIRPWQHVLDPLYGYLLLVYRQKQVSDTQNWNFGPDKHNFKKVIDIIRYMRKFYKFDFKIKKTSEKETQILRIDSFKSKKKLGWVAKLSFFESLNFIIDYEDKIKKGQKSYDICLKQIKEYLKSK